MQREKANFDWFCESGLYVFRSSFAILLWKSVCVLMFRARDRFQNSTVFRTAPLPERLRFQNRSRRFENSTRRFQNGTPVFGTAVSVLKTAPAVCFSADLGFGSAILSKFDAEFESDIYCS